MAGTATTWFAALTPNAAFGMKSQVREQPMTLLSAQIATTSAPTDAVPPPTSFAIVGDGATADPIGNWTPALGGIRCDDYKQISLSLEVFGTSGVQSVTFQAYFWDGIRWCASADTITVTNSTTSSTPGSRQRHDIVIENDFGFMLVITAISGTGATAAAYATLRDKILIQK